MRGRFNVGLSGVVWPRNTPAYAGKTIVRSEIKFLSCGTPPRMRENPRQDAGKRSVSGNTPAYAGKTLHHQRICWAKPDFSITSSSNKIRSRIPKPSGTAAES